jgi:hypothetical protein
MLKRNEQELEGKIKQKKHHGKYTNYCFNKDTFELIDISLHSDMSMN